MPRTLSLLAAAALLAAGGGCAMTLSPPAHRANQYSGHFATYTDEVQTRLRVATIAVGDDRTAVYIALGKPQSTRIGYDRDEATGKTIPIELWHYTGYPINDIEGRFMTLNNGGFASPIGSSYGKVTIEFAESHVRRYWHDSALDAGTHTQSRTMVLPADPHAKQLTKPVAESTSAETAAEATAGAAAGAKAETNVEAEAPQTPDTLKAEAAAEATTSL